MIELNDVTVRPGTEVLGGITLSVPGGICCAVVGPTGAGKTTLLDCIAGLRPVTAGSIRLDGSDVTHAPPERRDIGLVPQRGFLFPHLDVAGNIAYGATGSSWRSELLDLLELAPLLPRRVRDLSGGERQLVALARALARPARVLLLDEPFAALDYSRRRRVRDAVLGLARERGTTVVLVTHDLPEAFASASMAVHLEGGRLAAAGDAITVLQPLLSR